MHPPAPNVKFQTPLDLRQPDHLFSRKNALPLTAVLKRKKKIGTSSLFFQFGGLNFARVAVNRDSQQWFLRVNVNLDDLHPSHVPRRPTVVQNPVEARSHEENHVSARQSRRARGGDTTLVVVRQHSLAHGCWQEWDASALHELGEFRCGVRIRRNLAADEQRGTWLATGIAGRDRSRTLAHNSQVGLGTSAERRHPKPRHAGYLLRPPHR